MDDMLHDPGFRDRLDRARGSIVLDDGTADIRLGITHQVRSRSSCVIYPLLALMIRSGLFAQLKGLEFSNVRMPSRRQSLIPASFNAD